MKNTFFVLLALAALGFNACHKANDAIYVRYQNNTQEDFLQAVHVFSDEHQTAIGDIPAGATSEYVQFDYFEVASEIPMGVLQANGTENQISAFHGFICGTGLEYKQLEGGYYTLEINQFPGEDLSFYQLKFAD